MYCFTTSISHGVESYFLRLWGTGISDAILNVLKIPLRNTSKVSIDVDMHMHVQCFTKITLFCAGVMSYTKVHNI